MNGQSRKRKAASNLNLETKIPKQEEPKKTTEVLNIDFFAASRVVEIQALTDLVKNVGGNHQAFQKLPPHMRRRAMSHNIKRVPRRLHDVVKSELEKVKAPNKRPSRKYRRKPSNLLSEYEQRKRRIRWLDTHIWHAKRFKMMENWGYKLPVHPSNKSIRSCYRAVQRHCLLQDVSYEHYIEIRGNKENIIKGLCHVTHKETGPTFAAKMTCNGSREGSLYLYHYDSYPQKVIGKITYMWRPDKRNDTSLKLNSCLWICCHPAFQAEALKEIKRCFDCHLDLDKSQDPNEMDDDGSARKNVSTKDSKIEEENFVSVISLKNEIVKFRLFGPASNLVLKETLELWNTNELCTENDKKLNLSAQDESSKELEKEENETTSANDEMWWKSYYCSFERQEENDHQKTVLSTVLACRSPAESPPHLVMAATVKDPRLQLPPKRIKVSVFDAGNLGERLQPELFTSGVSASALWDKRIRQNVKATKIPEKTLNDMKSKRLVPGTRLELGEKESRIPIILVQRPGLTITPSHSGTSSRSLVVSQRQIGYASGWDILIPSGWAMAFWLALVYRGARVGGQQEAANVALQTMQMAGVRDTPDSEAGKKELETEAVTLQTKHDKRPPAKRPNFNKLGFDFPFVFPFDQLCKEWMIQLKKIISTKQVKEFKETSNMYVLRERSILKMLNTTLTDPRYFLQSKVDKTKTNSSSKHGRINILEKLLSTEEGGKLVEVHSATLVPVTMTVLQRGVPANHAHICIPSKEDLQKIKKMKNYGGPEENLHSDKSAAGRKAERKERLKLRKKKKTNQVEGTCTQKPSVVKDVKEQTDIPMKSYDFMNKTSRPIIGFVTSGDFDLGQGQGSGIGFCSVIGLLKLMDAWQKGGQNGGACLALVRNSTSLQYRFVSISIVL